MKKGRARDRYFFGQQKYIAREQTPRQSSANIGKRANGILATVCLLLILAGCSSGTTSTQTGTPTLALPTPTSTPTPAVPSGTVLYHTDWSKGLSGWKVPSQIKTQTSKGHLHLACGDNASMIANYQPATANYALEVTVQIVNVPINGGTFSLRGQKGPGKDGYSGGLASLEKKFPFHGQFTTFVDPPESSTAYYTADDSPGASVVTYRVEIQNGVFSFFVNGVRHGQAASIKTDDLSHGPLSLNCGDIVLNVGPLTITAL